MFKNTSGQKIQLEAYDSTSNTPKTGDASNITAYVQIDGGAVTVLADTSATELSSTNSPGSYQFDVAQAETNGNTLHFSAKSGTANIYIRAVLLQTFPACFGIAGGAAGGPYIAGSNAATTDAAYNCTGNFEVGSFGCDGVFEVAGAITASNAGNSINLGTGAITAGVIADNAIDRATFAADTGLRTVRSNTAQAGGNFTITYDAGASAVNDFYKSHLVYITGGTGAGQARFITGYTGASQVAVVGTQWQTNPDNTSTFADLPFDNLTTSLTAAAIDTQLSLTHGAGAWGSTATGGAYTITITVVDQAAAPLQNVLYYVRDNVGTLVGLGTTNASGQATFTANSGSYIPALSRVNYTQNSAGATYTVTGNQAGTLVNSLVMTAITPPSPSAPNLATITGTLLDGSGNVVVNALGTITLHVGAGKWNPVVSGGNIVSKTPVTFTTNASGLIKASDGTTTLQLIRTDSMTIPPSSADALAYWLIEWDSAGLKVARKFFLAAASFDISTIAAPQ